MERQVQWDAEGALGSDGELLADIATLRARARRSTGSPCWAALCFGATTALAALVLRLLGAGAFVLAWMLGGALTTLLVGRLYRRRGQRIGVASRRRASIARSWVRFAAIFAVATAAGFAGGPDGAIVASIVVVVGGYGLDAYWRRDAGSVLAVLGAAIPALALAVAGGAPWLIELTFGLALLAAGVTLYVRDERP